MKLFSIILIALFSTAVFATTPASNGYTKISEFLSFPDYGNGDVLFKISGEPIADCTHGFWLSPAQPGFTSNLSVLLSAFHAGSDIALRAHTDDLWPGSSGKYCKVYQVNIKK